MAQLAAKFNSEQQELAIALIEEHGKLKAKNIREIRESTEPSQSTLMTWRTEVQEAGKQFAQIIPEHHRAKFNQFLASILSQEEAELNS